jgi:histidinol-phosphate aminotransferase
LLPKCHEFSNLFVARTFSKAYGLAGLRIGVLVGNTDQIRSVRRVSSPYNVNAVALACLPEALADQTYIQQYVNEIRDSRTRLSRLGRTEFISGPARQISCRSCRLDQVC